MVHLMMISPAEFPGTAGNSSHYFELMNSLIHLGTRLTLICPYAKNWKEFDLGMRAKKIRVVRIPIMAPRLRHLRDKGGLVAGRYLHWENSHWNEDGGCKDYRTVKIEKEAIKLLVKLYPGRVSSAKRKANEFTIKLNL